MLVYNKLVRDKIPEIIAQSGKTCKTRSLSPDEYQQRLGEKLEEEVAEYLTSQNLEELADILEVVYALAALAGVSREKLEQVRNQKAKERGGFRQWIFLESVE
jgi:predicted house-cleaning noncanonical NTP pyrophosphatase (MazG superfamily)